MKEGNGHRFFFFGFRPFGRQNKQRRINWGDEGGGGKNPVELSIARGQLHLQQPTLSDTLYNSRSCFLFFFPFSV